ncbi:hypothetical protein M0P48_03170 [Candidatus Gracilibacteria bacterium]|jgi:hypothetical protein|nr:hypothetical protein [Candidatus Gracilibacteria bacterium]
MKKNFIALMMVVAISLSFLGCGSKEKSDETITKEAIENYKELAEVQQEIAKDYDPNNPEDVAKMMETYAEFGSKMELQEFDKAESVDAPSGFPAGLVYGKGKITSASDDGSEGYVNQSITIQTTETVKTVKDFYKNLFSQAPWKITSQSSEGSGASYGVTGSDGLEVSVNISSDSYSKLVRVDVWYSGSVAE